MSKLDELIKKFCPNGVEYKAIGDFAECYAGATPKTGVSEYWQNGTIPWMSSGEVNNRIILKTEKKITQEAYDNCSTKMVPAGAVVIALAGQGKTRGLVAITQIELCTNQSLCSIIPNETVKSDFLYHFLRSQYQQLRSVSSGDGTRGGLNLKIINAYKVPVPPLPVQEEIVRILDSFTKLEAELEAELEARRRQYEYYRKKLFDFKGRNVKFVKLDEKTCNITTGKLDVNAKREDGEYPFFTCDATPYKIDTYAFDTDAVIISGNGSQVGHITHYNGKFNAYQRTYVLSQFRHADIRYFFHYFNAFLKQHILKYAKKGSVPYITLPMLTGFQVPIPDEKEQQRIVAILDRFDTLVNDLTSGLPAEIKARRQQYEYYRDKLLTFKEIA